MERSSELDRIRIAIDGPAGAGKSSVARAIAEKLGILYLDTGAMYRAFAYYAENLAEAGEIDEEKAEELFRDFDLKFADGKVFLGDEDITQVIRTPRIDKAVSPYASNPFVRKQMVSLQRSIGQDTDIVMEGRDICTVVLKDSPYKFYLDASVEERARRRFLQNEQKGISEDMEAIKADIIRRDEADMNRQADPLRKAEDAIVVDSTDMSQEQVVDEIINKTLEIKNAL